MKEGTARNGRKVIANVERLHRLMDEAALDAIVVRGGQNVTYLSGVAFHGTLARHLDLAASRRGVAVVWPRTGKPVFVIEVTAAGPVERDSWIETLEIFSGYSEGLFDRVSDVLSDLGLDRRRIGFDRNFIGAGFWDDLERRLPNAELTDCSVLLDEARLIKTPDEIAIFRDGCRILDEAFLEVLPTIKPGEREREVHARLLAGCVARGAEFVHGILNSERNTRIYCGESEFVFAAGDIVRTDYVSYLSGYPGHQSRNAVIGKPTPQKASDYGRYREIYGATADRLRAGTAVGDLYESVVAACDRIGWRYEAGLVGHSIGTWWHQQEPIFCRGGRRELEPGMVVALEPYIGHWHCQDLFLITNTAPELLSPLIDTRELMVI